MQSDGGQKFDKYFDKGASDNLVSTFHPVNLATTVVPVARSFTAAAAVPDICSSPPLRMFPLESRLQLIRCAGDCLAQDGLIA